MGRGVSSQQLSFINSRLFRRLLAVLGLGAFLVSIFSVVRPEPFLPYGLPGIFLINALGGNSILTLSFLRNFHVLPLVTTVSLGIAVNDSLAWIAGHFSLDAFNRPQKLARIETSVKKYGPYAIFFWSFIPFPYDLVGLVAGYLGMPYRSYLIPTFLGKYLRFMILGTILTYWR
jgi:membrane protein DedA with SNARE-associated domain